MKIKKLVVVTNYPDDRRPLSEYAYHLVNGLRQARPSVEVVILAGKGFPSSPSVYREWTYGSPTIPLQICRSIAKLQPDAVMFNTHFTAWGSNLANFAGLLSPYFCTKQGILTLTLLHHLPQTLNAKAAGYKLSPLHYAAIELVCRALARSNIVCFTLERDRAYFARYKPRHVVRVPHGLLGPPKWSIPPVEKKRVLVFGNWGRNKDPRPVIRAFIKYPSLGTLIVAGQSSHTLPGFYEKLQTRYACDNVVFTGYVPEEKVANLFQSVSLVVAPYRENTGVSGVLHQACQYGRAVLIRRLPVFEEMVKNLGLTAFFYDTEGEIAEILSEIMSRPNLLIEAGRHNYSQVQHLTMDKVSEFYWKLLEEEND